MLVTFFVSVWVDNPKLAYCIPAVNILRRSSIRQEDLLSSARSLTEFINHSSGANLGDGRDYDIIPTLGNCASDCTPQNTEMPCLRGNSSDTALPFVSVAP